MASTGRNETVSEQRVVSRLHAGAPKEPNAGERRGIKQSAGIEQSAGSELTWLRLQQEQFIERSRSAVAAEDVPAYMEERRQQWPLSSGIYDEAERARYHRERQATRGHEAITPGEAGRIPCLHFLRVARTKPAVRSSPAGGFTQRVTHPETKDVAYAVPTRWMPKAMSVSPRAALYSTSITATEHRVLALLWDSIHPWDFHVNGRTVVKGVTQPYLASICDLSVSQISRVTDTLSEKGFIDKRRDPDPDNDCNRCVYYLSQYEYGHWTYPAGHSESGRARALKIWKRRRPKAPVEWGTITTSHIRRQKPKRDNAAEKLARDRLRRRTPETGLHGGENLGRKIARWMQEGAESFHNPGRDARYPREPRAGPDDKPPPDPGGGGR